MAIDKRLYEYFDQHLNVYWLRPESAFWDTIASFEISKIGLETIDIDLGSGNGIFSFITAGGKFNEHFDWFLHSDAPKEDGNVFDNYIDGKFKSNFITQMPVIQFDVAFDKKRVLLDQALTLDWYRTCVEGDITEPLPFEDESVLTVFSNILYWIPDIFVVISEIRRILKRGGRLILCLPDPQFVDFCPSYKSHLEEYQWMRKLNRGRAECIAKYYGYSDIKRLARQSNFNIVYHQMYLSRELLMFFDIGLRPLIRPLLKMTGYLNDTQRLAVKHEWIQQLHDDFTPFIEREAVTDSPKGFHLCVFEKPD